jgi:hypothetical protein
MRAIHCVVAGVWMTYAAMIGAAVAADWDYKIANMDGTPIKNEKGEPVDLTVRTIAINALMAPLTQEEQAKPNSGEEKVHRGELARKILLNDPEIAMMRAEDVALIKRLVNNFYPSPLVVEQAWRALEKHASSGVAGGPAPK